MGVLRERLQKDIPSSSNGGWWLSQSWKGWRDQARRTYRFKTVEPGGNVRRDDESDSRGYHQRRHGCPAKHRGEVNAATADLSNSERAAKFNKAFGLLGITAASAIGKSVGSIEKLQAKIESSGGAANKAAQEMESGIGGSFRKLLSAVEGIGIEIGSSLAGPISAFSDVLATVSGYITNFIKENQQLVLTIAGVIVGAIAVGAAILGAGVAMSVISFAIGTVISAMGVMATIIGSAVTHVFGSKCNASSG